MSGERRVFKKEFKLMSVELSGRRTYLGALAKELDIVTDNALPLA
jgi:transposase-like protein